MDISADISAVQSRIAQIIGTPIGDTPPVDASTPTANAGQFASMVQEEMARGQGGGMQSQIQAEMPTQTQDMTAGQWGLPRQVSGAYILPSSQIDSLVQQNAQSWGVDPALVKAIIANESAFNANATSPVGAQGLMQLMPGTAKDLGVSDAYNPAQNVAGGTRYIRGLLDRFGGDVKRAVAAYNAGPEAVDKYGGVPPYRETQNYVSSVLDSYEKYKTPTP